MRFIWGTLAALAMTGCQLTASQNSSSKANDKANEFIAAELLNECDYTADVADLSFVCDSVDQGTYVVVHPVEQLDELLESSTSNEIPAVNEDIWAHVQSQLTFSVPHNRRVTSQQQWFRQNPDYMQRVNKRAKPFLYHIVQELEKEGMPMELALLPIVESAFDPFAYSHGRAAGMWQFIPGTAKRFGMKQTWWYDGRRDVVAATEGAIKYLKYLHKKLDGDWLHAIAAYNSGEGRVLKAVRKNKKQGKPYDFWSLDLPRETEAYVPKLLALADLLKRQEELGFNWPELANEPFTDIVNIESQIDLALAAEMAELTVEELHALNPGFNRWATDPKGPHRLILPIDKVETFKVALGDTSDRQRLNWVRHKVKRGDSLLKLANKYHTSVDVIKQVNELRGNVIRAGDHVLVPVALKSLDYYSLSQDQRLISTQNKKRGSYQLTHTVKSGDTMWDISREYNVKLRSLAKWNGMAPTDPLKPGKTLVIWVNKVSTEQTDSAVMRTVTYTVRNGDSLARIASKFNVRIRDLTRWNQLNSKKYLQPGQKLKIYVDVTRT